MFKAKKRLQPKAYSNGVFKARKRLQPKVCDLKPRGTPGVFCTLNFLLEGFLPLSLQVGRPGEGFPVLTVQIQLASSAIQDIGQLIVIHHSLQLLQANISAAICGPPWYTRCGTKRPGVSAQLALANSYYTRYTLSYILIPCTFSLESFNPSPIS